MSKILDDNVTACHNSFMYYLHEEDSFNRDAFNELLQYLQLIEEITINEYKQLSFILCQTLKHFVYHFDDSDLSVIENLPSNYWECFDDLEDEIDRLKVK